MAPIREVIQSIIDKMITMNGFKRAWTEKHWKELVGSEAGKHSVPYKVENNILFVNVDSSVWNQELFMKRAKIIKKINQNFSQPIINEVKYQMGHFSKLVDCSEEENKKLLCFHPSSLQAKRQYLCDINIMKLLKRRKRKNKMY